MGTEQQIVDDEQQLRMPDVPGELWMLWTGHCWVVSVDDAPGGQTYLVATSEDEARAAADHQYASYDVECIPVRVK